MHSLSNTLFGSQDSYWRGGVGGAYPSLQPLGGMTPNSYSPYDQYSSQVTSRYRFFVLNHREKPKTPEKPPIPEKPLPPEKSN